jgi:hypothetical protein
MSYIKILGELIFCALVTQIERAGCMYTITSVVLVGNGSQPMKSWNSKLKHIANLVPVCALI